jgi:hypothetical protein
MGSITSWTRLEPRSRDAEMAETVRARVYDPLWLLARQWQVGEFRGEDTGTPVMARWRAEVAPLTRYHAGPVKPNTASQALRYDARQMPLEVMVERQRARTPREPMSLRLAVEAGLHFLRLLELQVLSKSYRIAFIARFALAAPNDDERRRTDAETLAYWDLMAGPSLDGRALAAAARGANGQRVPLPTQGLAIAAGDRAEVDAAVNQWLAWLDALYSEPPADANAWVGERMEYAFSVSAGFSDGETPLSAAEYTEGRLEWHSVDFDGEVSLGAAQDKASIAVVRTAMPAPVSFHGAPAQRFWEFEDARIDYGLLSAAAGDLPHLMLSEFATAYGNDWYVIPIDLPVGSLSRARSLVVTDTFGVQTLIRPVNSDPSVPYAGWSMYSLAFMRRQGSDAAARPLANLFYLAPSLVKNIESRPNEEVLFMRDEMANVAWAVERVVAGPLEQRLDLSLPDSAGAVLVTPVAAAAAPLYRLASDVPSNWVPLLPQRLGDGLRLVRARMLASDGSNTLRAARSAALDAGGPTLALYEEEVPREGMRVMRSHQLTRWFDGSTHLWIGCRKQVGRGEGSSGLMFDVVGG